MNYQFKYLICVLCVFFRRVHLFYMFPRLEEGGLSTYRTALVKNDHLTQLSKVIIFKHML